MSEVPLYTERVTLPPAPLRSSPLSSAATRAARVGLSHPGVMFGSIPPLEALRRSDDFPVIATDPRAS